MIWVLASVPHILALELYRQHPSTEDAPSGCTDPPASETKPTQVKGKKMNDLGLFKYNEN